MENKTLDARVLLLIWILILTVLPGPCRAVFVPLSASFGFGFYNQSCPAAESIVRRTIHARYKKDPAIPAHMIRLLFHECFVTGCDGSLLVNSTNSTGQAEKDASPNSSVAGYDMVDAAKGALENTCPGVVSCADIEVLLARDAIRLVGGPFFNVPTGRLDGRSSSAAQAANTLPSPNANVSQIVRVFAAKNFTVLEMVTLLGAHTIGAAFCQSFSARLYNFQNTNKSDPSMDPALVTKLRGTCPQVPTIPDHVVALDQGNGSMNVFDSGFYRQLQQGHGILEIDQAIALDNQTAPFVAAYAGSNNSSPTMNFAANFAQVILKLSTLDVLTGNSSSGGVRSNCAIIS